MASRFAPPGPLGFGGAPLGNMFGPVSEAAASAALDAAWDSGIRYFDTAPHYGAGLSEHRLEHAAPAATRSVRAVEQGRPAATPDPAVTTGPYPFETGLPFRASYDSSADGARRSIEDSLQRMGLARLDIVYIHDIAEDAHGPGWRGVLSEAMRQGAGQALTRCREEEHHQGLGHRRKPRGSMPGRPRRSRSRRFPCLPGATRCSITRR